MKEAGPKGPKRHYEGEYAKLYLDRTLSAPYTINKSSILADVATKFGAHTVLDIGSNVHGSVQTEGSLRFQMNKRGINYIGVDLSFDYFDRQFLRRLGIPDEKIYPQIRGIIGNVLQSPIKGNSMGMVICCDVLEHTPDPVIALREIFRIMKPEGVALIVLLSLYKLDMADFSHIEEKRKSSHLKKTTVDEWVRMCKESGFIIDEETSLPIGIASGLSYLAWMDEKFVPGRKDLSDARTYSPKSILHRDVKNILSKYDELIDSKIRLDGLDYILFEALRQGDTKKVFQILSDVASVIVSDKAERDILRSFFGEVNSMQYPLERSAVIQKIFMNSKFPRFLLGNSILLVLKRGNKLQ